MGDDIREHCIWKQANNIQNIKITCITQHLENKEPNLKMGRGVFFQRHMDDYQTPEMLLISLIFRKMHIRSKEIPHYCQNGKQKDNEQYLLLTMWRKGNTHVPLAACKHDGKQCEVSSNIKNRTTLLSGHSTPEYLPKGNKIINSKYIHTLTLPKSLFIMAKICLPKGPMI